MTTQFEKKVDKMIKEIIDKIDRSSNNRTQFKAKFVNKSLILDPPKRLEEERSKSVAQHYPGFHTHASKFTTSHSPEKKFQTTFVNIKNARYRLP